MDDRVTGKMDQLIYVVWNSVGHSQASFPTQHMRDTALSSNALPFIETRYQSIFPLANTFAKRENVRPGQPPTGTQMVSFRTFFVGVWLCH